MLDMKDPNDYPILGGSPSLKCSSLKRGGTIGIPSYWGTLQVKSHNLVARHSSRVWFDDGHETHNNMSLSTSLHRCLAPLAPNFVFYDGREKSPSAPLHRDLTPLVSTFWPWLDWHWLLDRHTYFLFVAAHKLKHRWRHRHYRRKKGNRVWCLCS